MSNVVVITTLIILVIAWSILIYDTLINRSPFGDRGEAFFNCPPSYCATNIFNGEKRCPNPGDIMAADAAIEVCNPSNRCIDSKTPFAVNSDNSTTSNTFCEEDQCRCLPNPQCANHIVSMFRTTDGNPYRSLEGKRTQFSQLDTAKIPHTNKFSSNTPFSFDDPLTTFCQIPIDFAFRSTPGCVAENNIIDEQAIIECLDQNTNKPCIRGVLSYLSNDPENFNEQKLFNTPLGCTQGIPCDAGEIPIYDLRFGRLLCKKL